MIQQMLRAITARYHLNAITLGEFTRMKVSGTEFQLWAFHADGLGHVSAVVSSGPLGLTKTETLTINPTEKDMPLFSYDRVQTMGKDTLICALYDTLLEEADPSRAEAVKAKYTTLPDQAPGSQWCDSMKLPASVSKKGSKSQGSSFDACAMEYLEAFLEAAEDAPYCDPAAKKEKSSAYVEGLLSNGGPNADIFLKSMGGEKAGFLFRNFLFGTIR